MIVESVCEAHGEIEAPSEECCLTCTFDKRLFVFVPCVGGEGHDAPKEIDQETALRLLYVGHARATADALEMEASIILAEVALRRSSRCLPCAARWHECEGGECRCDAMRCVNRKMTAQ